MCLHVSYENMCICAHTIFEDGKPCVAEVALANCFSLPGLL